MNREPPACGPCEVERFSGRFFVNRPLARAILKALLGPILVGKRQVLDGIGELKVWSAKIMIQFGQLHVGTLSIPGNARFFFSESFQRAHSILPACPYRFHALKFLGHVRRIGWELCEHGQRGAKRHGLLPMAVAHGSPFTRTPPCRRVIEAPKEDLDHQRVTGALLDGPEIGLAPGLWYEAVEGSH